MDHKARPLLLITLCLFLLSPATADLPSRYELLAAKYEQDRADGIRRLNKKYIKVLEGELDLASQSKDLTEANNIVAKISILKEEIDNHSSKSGEGETGESLLAGKTATYPQDRFPDFTATTVFHARGKATYTGVNLRPANFLYEESADPGGGVLLLG